MQRARERFQSTPSVGRATAVCIGNGIAEVISIHALRGESDLLGIDQLDGMFEFQSTPSVGRATGLICGGIQLGIISIHALREEGDLSATFLIVRSDYFNPRPPRGGRHLRYVTLYGGK